VDADYGNEGEGDYVHEEGDDGDHEMHDEHDG
jgi:hypothetical protein